MELAGFPNLKAAGGIDWLELSVVASFDDSFPALVKTLAGLKVIAQEKKCEGEWANIANQCTLVRRTGFNRGGERGQHFDFWLGFRRIQVALDARQVGTKNRPNLVVRIPGRECLLWGAEQGYDWIRQLIGRLGGTIHFELISRVDLCLDIANLCPQVLQDKVESNCFVTRAKRVEPRWEVVSNSKTGFCVGSNPNRLIVYDKLLEQVQKGDAEYLQAMVDRRYGGQVPEAATRIEFQLSRPALKHFGISTLDDFGRLRCALVDKLTHDQFRITSTPVDRQNKHQSRAKTEPLWAAIAGGFRVIFNGLPGELAPICADKIEPMRLIKQGIGCLRNAMLQMPWRVETFDEFLGGVVQLVKMGLPMDDDQRFFLADMRCRETEHLG